MKASLKFLFVVVLTTVANVALANVDKAGDERKAEVKAQIFATKNDMVYVQLEKVGNQKVLIKISDDEGNVLHSESIKEEIKVLKRFDISQLPAGSYSYEVSDASYSLRKRIEKE